MRLICNIFSMQQMHKSARRFLLPLILTAFISFFAAASGASAQSTPEVCRETRKVYDGLKKEFIDLEATYQISRNYNYFAYDALPKLKQAVNGGYIASRFDDIDAKLPSGFMIMKTGKLRYSDQTKDRLAYQQILYDFIKEYVAKASEVEDDQELLDRIERVKKQMDLRQDRLDALNCGEVLDRETLSRNTGAGGCFASDPGMGSTNRQDHYKWAENKTGAQLEANLKSKINLLYNCPAVSDDDFANAFADFSVSIANYVRENGRDETCFNGDRGVVSTDRSGHYYWARAKTRQQLLENLQWKIASALKCLDDYGKKLFFGEISVRVAKAPQSNPTNTGGTTNDTGGNNSGGNTGNTSGGNTDNYKWAGTYSSGNATMTVSGGDSSVSAEVTWDNGDSKGKDSFIGCQVRGNVATNCQWKGTEEDIDKTTDRHGTCDLTLNGDSIAVKCKEDEPSFHVKPGREDSFNSFQSKMHKGAVWENTYTRKQ